MNLRSAFEALGPEASPTGTIRVEQVRDDIFVGRTNEGGPVVFIRTADRNLAPKAMRLEHIFVEDERSCTVELEGDRQYTDRFTVVRCTAADRSLQEVFVDVVDSMLQRLPVSPSVQVVRTALTRLFELFEKLSEPARKSVAGLWGELFVIARVSVKRIPFVVGAWHTEPGARFDFASGVNAVEVKLTSGQVRRHNFSLDQLREDPGASIAIASIITQPSAGGVTVLELYRSIRLALGDDTRLIEHFDQVVLGTLGTSATLGFDLAFDRELAERNLRFFSARSIPRPALPLPPEVSDVHFAVDLSNVSPISRPVGGSQLIRALMV